MNVLIVGSGGREHALAWALSASPLCDRLLVVPGNAGIAADAEIAAECVPIASDDLDGLVALARDRAVDLVVVGPEAPLVAGLVDRLEAAGIAAFGPSAEAAVLEGSKSFMKELCARHGIPTARFARFREAAPAKDYIRAQGAPIVVKADGLAAGKGVVVAATVAEAEAAVDAMLEDGAFGAAGAELVIEECLVGPEASLFALVDGSHALPLAAAHDYKRAQDGDVGPNTGGMGAVSPTPRLDAAMLDRAMAEIVRPTVAAMAAEGRPFKGVLYAGLMLTADGPKLLEYNVRFGDPECQALVRRLKSDLLPALLAARDGSLAHVDLRWREETALCVVLASSGYPGVYAKGTAIAGLEAASAVEAVKVFHAGTGAGAVPGGFTAQGGRVLNVTATGADLAEARARAYRAVAAIDWPAGQWRQDIGQ